ncbi:MULTISPECIES: iron-hydroxamate ABC transporter substrate-binding protein [unclassified Lysinibacillus]|uniref:iron-hydroxamate ABC transporter substrate-binding protein n=1 Tax=unclassified Lysinibacillus TaxID=2636778 RepID=UPI0020137283|nr:MULTISPECIES: iron-hydroxamate ABC transporter substrate-binding protein [unclassified Lysinibacillus]MCL1694471.1 iron-hydroxamate ABC transporter substrate-binding protein [Lysinibacillus sp. BPa_S21]MCL1699302.1 iron-hydroxamate ABC transporter substrate-binding protein [Lysinibacillus sp. Bpr_S20]
MKKWLLPMFMMVVLVLAACGNKDEKADEDSKDKASAETITYQAESGPIKVPAHPKRVVVLSSFAGDLLQLGVNVVGVDSWAKDNPNFQDDLKNAVVVENTDIEKMIELEPDLIIGLNGIENADKLAEIAPTVLFTYGKVDYLQQFIEIGKVVNKEKEATDWVKDFKERAAETGTKIKEKIGEDATVTVAEMFNKQMYVYGDNWGRGTELLYQEMGLKMPGKVKEDALKPGYFAISTEVLNEYAGDYVIFSTFKGEDSAIQNAAWFKDLEAVKNGHLFAVNGNAFYFNDPKTLEYQLDFFEKKFLQ